MAYRGPADPAAAVGPVTADLPAGRAARGGVGRYQLRLDELAAFGVRMRATLDCTSGWYARQDWSGVPVSALLRSTGQARSLLVHSVTGYWIRLPVSDVGRLGHELTPQLRAAGGKQFGSHP